jgi:hypothetical protein
MYELKIHKRLLKDRRGDQRGGEWEPIKIPHGIWHISQKSTQIHSTKPSNVIGLVKRNQDRERSVLALRSASHGTPLKNQDWGDLCGRTNINNRTHAVTRLGEASAFGWRARKKNRSDRVRSAAQGLGSQRSDTQKKNTRRDVACAARDENSNKGSAEPGTIQCSRLLCLNVNQNAM